VDFQSYPFIIAYPFIREVRVFEYAAVLFTFNFSGAPWLLTYWIENRIRTKNSDKVPILLNSQISSFKLHRQKLLHSFCWIVIIFTISFFKFPFSPYHLFWSKNVFKNIGVTSVLESFFLMGQNYIVEVLAENQKIFCWLIMNHFAPKKLHNLTYASITHISFSIEFHPPKVPIINLNFYSGLWFATFFGVVNYFLRLSHLY